MPYLIDGHNLIPHVKGISLVDPDDEQNLIQALQVFCRMRRQPVEVFFDRAPAGQARQQRYGAFLQAHFTSYSSTADQAIRKRLARLGRQARNWSVVTSDRAVQAEARAVHAQVISSAEFAGWLQEAAQANTPAEAPAQLSAQEMQEWLEIFGGKQSS